MSRDEQVAAQTQGTGVGPEPHALGTRGLTAGAEHVKSAALPHGQMFDLSEHLAAALDIAERLDREQESVDTTTLVAHLRIVSEDYTDGR